MYIYYLIKLLNISLLLKILQVLKIIIVEKKLLLLVRIIDQ